MYYVHIDRNTGKVCGLIAIPKSIQRGGGGNTKDSKHDKRAHNLLYSI